MTEHSLKIDGNLSGSDGCQFAGCGDTGAMFQPLPADSVHPLASGLHQSVMNRSSKGKSDRADSENEVGCKGELLVFEPLWAEQEICRSQAAGAVAAYAAAREEKLNGEIVVSRPGKAGSRQVEVRLLPGIEIVMGALLCTTAIANARRGTYDQKRVASPRTEKEIPGAIQGPAGSELKATVAAAQVESPAKLERDFVLEPEKSEKNKGLSWLKAQAQSSLCRAGLGRPRRRHVICTGDTLEHIAVTRYQDRRVASLIADLNRSKIKETMVDSQRVVEIFAGQSIELPEAQEARFFLRQCAAGSTPVQRVITLVSDLRDHSALMYQVLRGICA
jgi:hypothetical protein